MAESVKLAAPCGLYCGACIYYLTHESCHGCGCDCAECDALRHHDRCGIYICCVENSGYSACYECEDFPCSRLIQFCFNPVWQTHLPVIENLRRRRTIGEQEWLREQKDIWGHKRYLKRWLWFQKKCIQRLRESKTGQK